MYAICSKCYTSDSLSISARSIASSFAAETHALEYELSWCNNYKVAFHFQSIGNSYGDPVGHFHTFNAPLISPIKVTLKCLVPHFITLSNSAILNFEWVPSHANTPRNEYADSLAITRASLPTTMISFSLPWSKPVTLIITNGYITYPTPISTVKFHHFLGRNWSSLAPYALSFPASDAMVTFTSVIFPHNQS